MIFPLGGILIGALIGALRARSRSDKTADLLQWAAVHGIAFGLIGLFVLVIIERSVV